MKRIEDHLEIDLLTQFGSKFALLRVTPIQVAITTLIKSKTSHLSQKMEILSSLKTVFLWLNIEGVEEPKVKCILEEALI